MGSKHLLFGIFDISLSKCINIRVHLNESHLSDVNTWISEFGPDFSSYEKAKGFPFSHGTQIESRCSLSEWERNVSEVCYLLPKRS